MNGRPRAEVLPQAADEGRATLAPSTAGVLRHVWNGRYGVTLIEVIGEEIFVNGERIEQHRE